jgi:uncharacterized repeat protein (TIGR01451 family)
MMGFATSRRGRFLRCSSRAKVVLPCAAAAALFLLSSFGQDQEPDSAKVTSAGARHKVQVNDPVLGEQIKAQGGKLIADYGAFQLYDAADDVETFSRGHKADLRDEYNFIHLNAGRLDTRKLEVQALRKAAGNLNGKRMHLVQFAGPIQPGWRSELTNAGAEIVAYIPQNTYLIYGDAPSISRIQQLASVEPHVQWESDYLDDYKIHPGARPGNNPNAAAGASSFYAIQLVEDAAANDATLQVLEKLQLEPLKRKHALLHYVNLIARMTPQSVDVLAKQPDVVSIQPYAVPQKFDERQDQIIAGNIVSFAPSGPGYLAWLAGKGFTQAQFTNSAFAVDVSDSGIDDGTTSPNHFGLYLGGSVSNSSRVIYNRLQGTANGGSTLSGCDGHGTLNSHIIGGFDDFTGFPFADASGYHYGLGVCPFVKLGSSVIFDPHNFTFPVYNNLHSQAYHDGARISNNSWGANTAGAYNTDAQNYDALVRDAQPTGSTFPVAGNQEMVIVFAAGNAGPGVMTVGAPGTAKNVITVGAAENVQAFGGADASGIDDTSANNTDDIAFFSSRGPTSDGRHKPEIVAPGTHVSGGVAQMTNNFVMFPNGVADSCFDGSGVSGGVAPNPFFPAGQQFYTASSGTSHSTPAVAGACALLRQYFLNNFTNAPSPAITKAWLMNSARYLTGVSANDNLWSDNQGMGELNLGFAFDGVSRVFRDEVVGDIFSASGQTRTFTGFISDTNKPFRVTLAWTDAPGSTTGNSFNNDLDLTVTMNGVTYKGNVFNGAFSVPGGNADSKDNAESVFLPAGVGGTYVVTVTAQNINSDGVPNNADTTDQDFALVIYNATAASVPVLIGAGTTLTAESCLPTNGVVDPFETVTLNFSLQNIGTVNASNVVGTLLATGGVSSPGSPQTYTTVVAGDGAVSMPFSFTAGGTCGGTITATLQLHDDFNSLGNVMFTIPLGKAFQITNLMENFDGVTAPALPAGWTTTASGAESPWTTSSATRDTVPNSMLVPCPSSPGLSELVSPAIPITTSTAQLNFRNRYTFESSSGNPSLGFDGGVLEIQIGGGAFMDILSAGGSFVTGGYTRILSSSFSNPLGGRQAWSGKAPSGSGFITTTVNLPSAAAGQAIHLKWRCGTDNGGSSTGWNIDTLSVTESNYSCCSDATDLAVTQSALPNPAIAGQNFNYTVTVSNLGPNLAASVAVTDALPASLTFVTGSSGFVFTNGNVVYNLGSLPSGAVTNITVTVSPTNTGFVFNHVTVSSYTPDLNPTNNTANLVTTVDSTPVITQQPTNRTVLVTGSATFFVTATSVPSPGYQWQFNGTNLPGQTSSTLTLNNIQSGQAGDYSVVVTNAVGTTNSDVATLTVLVPPAITAQPSNRTVLAGSNVSFQVTASGVPPPGFQWFFDGTNLAGANASVLAFTNVQPAQAGSYSVQVTNAGGSTNSLSVTLVVLVPPTITSQPSNLTVLAGADISLQVAADGIPSPNYQWLLDGTNVLGATNSVLTLTNVQAAAAGDYQVVVTNSAGSTNSAIAHLKILVAPDIAGIQVTATNVIVSVMSVNGLNYTLEYKNSALDADWTPIAPSTPGTGGVIDLPDDTVPATSRLYRVRAD